MTPEEHVQALRDLNRRYFEDEIAEIQQWADERGAADDVANQRLWLDHIKSLRSLPLPWEQPMPVFPGSREPREGSR